MGDRRRGATDHHPPLHARGGRAQPRDANLPRGDARDWRRTLSWDLQPKSTMTNANIEQVVTGVDGQTLTVKYKDGDKKIIVPPDVPIVTFAPGDKADLKPGTKIFIGASKKLPDGTVRACGVNYGKDGLTPPM